MTTRLRKTRKLRGSRTHGWGQVAQHRASGHKGGLGISGQLKHHFSSMLKYDPDHFGHDSTHPPHPTITKKWASVRDLDDLFEKFGKKDGEKKKCGDANEYSDNQKSSILFDVRNPLFRSGKGNHLLPPDLN